MAKKYLFINHFPIPDENLKQKKVKDLPAVLHEIFYKSDINEFENPSSLPSLQ